MKQYKYGLIYENKYKHDFDLWKHDLTYDNEHLQQLTQKYHYNDMTAIKKDELGHKINIYLVHLLLMGGMDLMLTTVGNLWAWIAGDCT